MKSEIQIPCMFHPNKVCKNSCLLHYLNLVGIIDKNTTQADIEIAVSELRLQPEIRARAHELKIQKIDPFLGLDCEQNKMN